MGFKDEIAEMRKTEGAGRDVCSRCTEIAGSQVAVTLALGAAETFPKPAEAAGRDGGAASRPLHRARLCHGPPRQPGEDSGCI